MRCEDVQGRPKRSRSFKVKISHLEREKLVNMRVVEQTFRTFKVFLLFI